MEDGGILGFRCAYQYPQKREGTYFYERYPRTLKGTDAALFTLFRAFGLTVHIKAHEENRCRCIDCAAKRCRDTLSGRGDLAEVDAMVGRRQISDFECSDYVGDEIFQSVTWINQWTARDEGKEYHEVAGPVDKWIGNETEIEWDYVSLALLVVVPGHSERKLQEGV
jgi:hypothetical protein